MIDRRPRTAPISMFALGPLLGAALAAPALAQDGTRETLGFNALHARLGADAPDGTGITVGYAEAPANDLWGPNLDVSELSSKVVSVESPGTPGESAHSTIVMQNLCGDSTRWPPASSTCSSGRPTTGSPRS